MPNETAKCPSPVKITGRDPVSQLYRAVQRYVATHGGSLVVIGGVSLFQMPGDLENNFYIGVRCTGQKPEFVPKRRGKSDGK